MASTAVFGTVEELLLDSSLHSCWMSVSQVATRGGETFKVGSASQTRGKTTTSRAVLAIAGPRHGSSEATHSRNGSHPVLSCGFVANVSPFLLNPTY
jgi:hypothetical protein